MVFLISSIVAIINLKLPLTNIPYIKYYPLFVSFIGWLRVWWKFHLVSDNDYNIVNMQAMYILQGPTNNVGLAFDVGDITPWVTITIERDY
jgi:hypothetical protein